MVHRAPLVILFALVAAANASRAQQPADNSEWRVYGGDAGSRRHSPLDQITRENVKNLQVAWTWKSDNFGTTPEYKGETTPIMIGGVLYFTAGNRRNVVAADAGTGETIWTWRMDEGARFLSAPRRNSGRGVAFWGSGRGDDRIFTVTPGFRLVALDAHTGHPITTFGDSGVVDLFKALGFEGDLTGTIGNSSPPVVSHGVVIVGPALIEGGRPKSMKNTKADVMAFDVRTGKKVWTFHTIPRPGEFGYDTWIKGADYTGNAGVWTPFSVDEELGYAYLPVEDATGDYYGGHRPGMNLFASTLVCVDVRTGKRVWHYQLVHHDIWDYDVTATPILVDITVGGKPVKAVVQATKQSFAFVFDRLTGKPVWPIEERPVAQTDVPGEWTSATQPFPTKPPPFDRQGISVDDLIDFTPELRQQALVAIAGFRIGSLYTPPSLMTESNKGTIVLPGSTGGANWESGAADPETGFVYIASQTRPAVYGLGKSSESDMDFVSEGGAVPRVQGLNIIKPPYGRITAFNMNTGEIAWQIANGDTPDQIKDAPALKGITLPRTGSASRATLLVTKTLLFAGEGFGGLPMFRAHDKHTGEILWETRIPAGALSGLPMTYMHNGRQFIVFAAGDPVTRTPVQLVAYALPAPRRTQH
jgi:quinoprotein glucose dehydrogenase